MLKFPEPVTLVGGGDWETKTLKAALAHAPHLIAADGAADALAARGFSPEAVVGDMDSVADPEAWRARLGERFLHEAEQETTDFQKCLRLVHAPLYLAVGFLGARLDHTLAAIHALAAHDGPPVALLGPEDIAFAAPAEWRCRVGTGTRVSIWPMQPVQGVSEGLRWPIDGLDLACGGRIGTSNEAVSEEIRLTFDRPGAMILLPAGLLDAAVGSLLAVRSVFRE